MEEEAGRVISAVSRKVSWKDNFNRQSSGCVGGQWQKVLIIDSGPQTQRAAPRTKKEQDVYDAVNRQSMADVIVPTMQT